MAKHLITIGSYKAYAEDIITEAQNIQAQHLKPDARVILVDNEIAAVTGNMYIPQNLWTVAKPSDNLLWLKGKNVCVFPESEESAKRWREVCTFPILSVLTHEAIVGMTERLPEIFY